MYYKDKRSKFRARLSIKRAKKREWEQKLDFIIQVVVIGGQSCNPILVEELINEIKTVNLEGKERIIEDLKIILLDL